MMVELKGIAPPFPLYGEMKLEGNAPFSHHLLANHGVIVGRPVLERLGLKVGDPVKIGTVVFQIRGVLVHEPGPIGALRFGPRVMIDRATLESAGLTGFGSRARRKMLFKIEPSKMEGVMNDLRQSMKGSLTRVRTYKSSEENLNRQFTRAENFLSLTGLVILVLGGIGISSVTRVFLDQKKKSIAVLKCLGASGKQITAAYLMQILFLGIAGSLTGIVLAKLALFFVGSHYSGILPPNMSYSLQRFATLQGLLFGVLVTLLFSALPLLRIRNIKPNVLLREEWQDESGGWKKIDPLRWIVAVVVTASLVALASWQAGSWEVGAFFLGGLLLTAGILQLAAILLIKSLRSLRAVSTFEIRHAISGLHRPGNQTRVITLAVGLGSFFILGVAALQSNLLRELDFSSRANMANMYLIDIQKDQRNGVEQIIEQATGKKTPLIPTIRSRIVAINGKELDPESERYQKDRQRLAFEYSMTYRDYLDPTETVLAGKFWDKRASENPEISIEESLQGMMGVVDIGSTITFDILGRRITARVTSIRRVDWHNARTGFFIVFRPGMIESAPAMYIAAINAPSHEPARSRFQRELVDAFPNITAIDVNDIVSSVTQILNNVTLAVSFLGGFVFLSGLLILLGSIAMTKFQRVYEAAVLKTLGAKRRTILSIIAVEYGLLGIVAGFIGAVAGMGLSYTIGRFVFEIPWHYTPLIYGLGIVGTALLVILTGAASSLDVLNRKPLAILRSN